jgi:hemolysin activation/secretion protein
VIKILTVLVLELFINYFFNDVALASAISDEKDTISNGKAKITVDNTGTPELGKYQIKVSAKAFNPTSNDSLKLDLGTSNKPKRSRSISIDYLKKLNSHGTSASLLWSYTENNPYEVPCSKYSVDNILKGKLGQYFMINNNYNVKLELAAQQRYIKNYLKALKTSEYRYILGSFGGKIKFVDLLSAENKLHTFYNWSLSKVSYAAQDCNKNFNYFTFNWDRKQPLSSQFSLFLKASYQGTNKLLPPEHKYAVGTEHTSRGYMPGTVSGDQGITGIVELRHKKEFKNERIKKFLEEGKIFIFYDITHFIKHNRAKHQISSNKLTLSAAGAGLKLSFTKKFYLDATAEYPLQKCIVTNQERKKNKPIYRFLIKKEFNW